VKWALRHRIWIAGITLITIVLGVYLYFQLESDYLPDMDEGGYVLDYITPPGTSLATTDAVVRKFEQRIKEMPETAAFSRRTGAEMGLYATQQNKGDILVKLVPRSQRKRTTEDIMDYLRPLVAQDAPGVEIEFTQILQDMLGDLQGTPEPVEVKLFGDNVNSLEQVADEVGDKIQKIPGIVDYKGIQKGNPEIVFHVDPTLAGRVGLSVDQITQQVSAGLLGVTETSLRQGDRTIDIRVRFPDAFRYNYSDIAQYPIVTQAKQIVPLNSLAAVEQVQGENQLLRENQRLMVSLTARLENRDLGSTMADVQKMMSTISLPTGVTYEAGGQYEAQQQSFKELLGVLALALAAVFTVLVVQFRAIRPSLIIISAAPLSLVGVFAMLLVTGTPLNFSSFMGIILMVGLVVKNGIILFEYVGKLREEGMPLDEALAAAGRIRVRPILMTTLATLFGLLPLALKLGAGAEVQSPLALAVIGGLLLSTFITLFVMPTMYSLIEHHKKPEAAQS
jgi:multidrug efflux pump subunit AcrB